MKIRLTKNNHSIDAELISQNPYIFEVNRIQFSADIVQISKNLFSVILNNESWFLSFQDKSKNNFIGAAKNDSIITIQNELEIFINDFGFVNSEDEKAGIIFASIPGLITKLYVKVDDKIEAGSNVCVLEAMKMENEINAPISGKIKSINVGEGSSMEKGDIIMVIEPNVVE